MKYIATIWWIIRNYKSFVKVYTEGKDVYDAIKVASEDKKITKAEYESIINEIVQFVESLKLGGK